VGPGPLKYRDWEHKINRELGGSKKNATAEKKSMFKAVTFGGAFKRKNNGSNLRKARKGEGPVKKSGRETRYTREKKLVCCFKAIMFGIGG